MDLLTFISKVIDAIAWPTVILILGIVFRRSVSDLFPFLRKIKAGPVEAEFGAEARKLLEESKEIIAGSGAKEGKISSEEQEADVALAKIYIAKHDPTKMILEGWRNVDGALFRFGKDAGIIVDPMDSTNNVYTRVITTDLLEPETKKLVIEIYEMRNRVAQANLKPSLSAAKDYILAVEQIVKLIEKQRESVEKVGNAIW
ncbi:hypothetical protein H5232_01785 [Pseudoalteromonas sp. SG41-5]|uniref:hypothetical protein n=1 Tax=Pseudoalteromonas sp. SG41-5 TaxID=2760975 RepID=UPI001602D047|nr:hypothetical protein [Pseudoalteromonas sp. SG41-5]MBB1467197.1 hypothetical protein [Pseudoalteromonas sp. SG41-5]